MTRKCERLRGWLPEHAEGALVGRARAKVERHVASCERCAQELADLRVVLRAVHAISPAEAPAELVARVAETVPTGVAPARPPARVLWPRLALPLALLTGMVAVSFAIRAPKGRYHLPQVAEVRGSEATIPEAPPAEVLETAPVAPHAIPPAAAPRTPGRQRPTEVAPAQLPDLARPPASPMSEAVGGRESESVRDEPRASEGDLASRSARERYGALMVEPAERPRAMLEAADRVEAPPTSASAFARATLVTAADGAAIALVVASEASADTISVRFGDRPVQRYEWRGGGPQALIPVPQEVLGAGPTTVRVQVSSSLGEREYLLCAPTTARLGESAPGAPVARYDDAPLSSVLTELSAFTGLVVLAELPLDFRVSGEFPRAAPEEVLRRLADEAGYNLHREGSVAFTLSRRP